jgi:hypothetical protein
LLPADSGEPRIAPARPHELRPLARIVAELAGRVTPGAPRTYSALLSIWG